MPEAPRCRFAPSPTGYLHVGGAHSALANWLFARHTGGTFLLRIEDTDAERNRPELTENVLEMLRWLGLTWDGDPVHQSDRFDLYRQAADRLLEAGTAYACDCTPDEVQARHGERGGPPGYDGHCRDRGLVPAEGRALRFRVPDSGATGWTDLIRGEVRFEHANLEDFVLLRSSGAPTFLLANAVDDADMAITHVIRGEDHVNGTPKYLLIRGALGSGVPAFAHMPLLVNQGRKKLSKRRDDVSVADYRARGYLAEAMVNYLALLGWGPPDGVEVRPLAEIVDLFDLADVNPAPAFFDPQKLAHVNGEYIRALEPAAFVERAAPFVPPGEERAREALEALAVEVRDRVRTLAEVPELIDFLWRDEPDIDEAAWEKAARGKGAAEVLEGAIAGLSSIGAERWEPGAIRTVVEGAAVEAGLVNAEGRPQLAKAQAPLRVAVTGRAVGPPLFESLAALGPDRTLARLQAARARLP